MALPTPGRYVPRSAKKNPFAGVKTSTSARSNVRTPSGTKVAPRPKATVSRSAPARKSAPKVGANVGRAAASGAKKVSARKVGTSTGRAASSGARNVSRRSSQQSFGGDFGGGGGSFGGGGGGATSFASSSIGTNGAGNFAALAAPPEPPAPKTWDELSGAEQEDYLGGDSTYVAQRAALLQALAEEESAADRESNEFGQDIAKTLRNLGWAGAKFEADDAKDTYKFTGGGWNPEDRLGAYGQAFGNQENDFAARGMLDSSAYDRSFTDLRNSFDQQRGDVMDSFTTFLNNAMGRRNQARGTQRADEQRARADAIARRAASLGLV